MTESDREEGGCAACAGDFSIGKSWMDRALDSRACEKEFLHFVIVSNLFFQITTGFHLLSVFVKRSATLPHVRFILGRSTPYSRIKNKAVLFYGSVIKQSHLKDSFSTPVLWAYYVMRIAFLSCRHCVTIAVAAEAENLIAAVFLRDHQWGVRWARQSTFSSRTSPWRQWLTMKKTLAKKMSRQTW